jgi:N-acetylglucosaminyl-diphospho-decaprenol L-rhamnosyltransferase
MVPKLRLRLPDDVTHDLSVIIVSYNTRDIILACVDSIVRNSDGLNIEIIVVDNCSSDGSANALRAAFPYITVIDSPTNGGFSFGNNIGLEQCHGEYILMLNPDTEILSGCLTAALNHLKQNLDIGLLGAQIRYPDGRKQNSMIRFLSLKTLFFLLFLPSRFVVKNHWMGDHRYGRHRADTAHTVDCVMGSFMMLPRVILQQVGGLDHRFFMYGEECELAHRIKAYGKQTVYFPAAQIIHHSGASTQGMNVWQAVEMTRGHILFLRFTRGAGIAWTGILLMAARDLVRLPYYAFQTILHGFRPSPGARAWMARLKFLLKAIVKPPTGQDITLPDPARYKTS